MLAIKHPIRYSCGCVVCVGYKRFNSVLFLLQICDSARCNIFGINLTGFQIQCARPAVSAIQAKTAQVTLQVTARFGFHFNF